MKKTKGMVRIIAGILVAIMVLGLIVPYVSATEVEETGAVDTNTGDVNVDVDTENDYDEELEDEESDLPPSGLPYGFEYKQYEGSWYIAKKEGNDLPAMIINSMPFGFDAEKVTVFIGSLETHEVVYYDLYSSLGYVSSIDLEDGYYVIFANNFAWCDSTGNAYAINGGEHRYIYIGDNYDPDIYGVEFETANDMFKLSLGAAPSNMQKIKHNANLIIENSDICYPEEAKLEKLADRVPHETMGSGPIDGSTENTSEQGDDNNDNNENNRKSIWSIILGAIKESLLLYIGIAACGVGLLVIKMKKRLELSKQIEEDKYDDERID